MWEPKSNKNKILILQKCAFGLMFFGNFYEGEGGLNREGGGLINFPPLKRGSLLERGGLFERGGLIEDLW